MCFPPETSLGVDMNLKPKRKEYKDAIFTFGYGFIYILMRPWLRFPPFLKLSSFSKELKKALHILHDFSTSIINERSRFLKETEGPSSEKRSKAALLDLLLMAKNNRSADIDEEGIKEEVDTFMFEVRYNRKLVDPFI